MNTNTATTDRTDLDLVELTDAELELVAGGGCAGLSIGTVFCLGIRW
jgi:hypothetical protein